MRFIAALLIGSLAAMCRAGGVSADSLAWRVGYQQWVFPQEKVYVATDMDGYMSGDTVRFRAFLVNAATHMPAERGSRFVYVELVDPFGDTVERVKVMARDGVFAGMIPLPADMPEGTYTLGAYTVYMQNPGSSYFFRKALPVRSYLSRKYRLRAECDGRRLEARLTERESGRGVKAENIALYGPDGVLAQGIHKRAAHTFALGAKTRLKGVVKVKFDRYEKFFTLPADSGALSVTFHPEGGYLIPGEENMLAFKAIARNGLAEDVAGAILDSKGDSVATFRSAHRGMGAVRFTPKAGEEYRAVAGGQSFALPAAEAGAAILRVRPAGADSIDVAVAGAVPPEAAIIAHNFGRVTYVRPAAGGTVRLNRNALGAGIVQLLLADNHGDVRSSRMIFNHSDYLFNVPADSLPPGDYAVRVVERSGFKPEESPTSIVAELMLQSELKGHVEDPNYYFEEPDSAKRSHMDLLMLTQGWERYDIPAALKGNFALPAAPVEIGGEITGTVRSRWRARPLAGAHVALLAPSIGYAGVAVTDSAGRYVVNGLDWPDGTPFAVQVFNKSGNREHNFGIDSEKFPAVSPLGQAAASAPRDDEEQIPSAGTILLNEIRVTAPRSSEEARREMFKALGVHSFSEEEMERDGVTTYEDIINRIPGLRVVNGNVVASAARTGIFGPPQNVPVEFWVDNVRWEPPYGTSGSNTLPAYGSRLISESGDMPSPLSSYSAGRSNTLWEFAAVYPLEMMQRIEYFRPSMAMVISLSAANGAGALAMTTKDGSKRRDWHHDLFMRVITPKGYQSAPEAYEPHFTYDALDDDATPGTVKAAWYPAVTSPGSIPRPEHAVIIAEGLGASFLPAFSVF